MKKTAEVKTDVLEAVEIAPIQSGGVVAWLLGTTPIILNRVSEKAQRELLYPRGKKNAAERASTLKHEPLKEFQASPYVNPDPTGPTLIQHLASAIKGAMKGAALDLPGSSKAQIGRLVHVNGERLPLYGVPQIFMSVVRNAGIVRQPDIRTRAIIPHWAMRVEISFIRPLIREQSIFNLLAGAGVIQGTGDWRPEKGSGTFGQWRLVGENDPALQHVMKTGGRAAQLKAMGDPEPYDAETSELFRFHGEELGRRMTKSEQPATANLLNKKKNGEARI